MSRKFISLISIVIILIISIVQVSYAKLNTNLNSGFLRVNAKEIAKKETLEITFNLDEIKYDKFKIVLDSNINNKDIYTNNNITLGEKSDSIVINIDKNNLNLNKMTLYYTISEELEINSKINLNAKAIIEEEIESQDDSGNTISTKQEKIVQNESISITVIEKKETTSDKQNKQPDNSMKLNSSNKSFNISGSVSKQSSSMSSFGGTLKTETATYNGSNNNYLNSLSVKGINLNTEFNKENTNYFINVTDKSKLKINYKVEDSNAKVSVTGNDSIKEGTNKILITVTAENGDVRYYRIFAKCTLNN